MTPDKIAAPRQLIDAGTSITNVVAALGVGQASVRRALARSLKQRVKQ